MNHCRLCGGRDLRQVLSLGEQPPANALTAGPAERVPVYPLDVLFCASCSVAQLGTVVPPEQLFCDYPYFSSASPGVVENARRLVARLVAERGLGPGSLAMEVASNDGYLLQHYRAAGVEVLGIDPARNIAAAAEARGVRTVPRFFTRSLAEQLVASGLRADVLHAHNVLAHVPDANDLVAGIADVLGPAGVLVAETPSLRALVDNVEYDTIYHEHVYYYSGVALERLLARHGLRILDIEAIPIHGGSLRVLAGRDGEHGPSSGAVAALLDAERRDGVHTARFLAGLARRVERLRAEQRAFLDRARAAGQSVAGYGAAAKATVLLHAVGASVRDVAFVVDRSPHKQGRYLPNTAIPILAPEELARRRPDYAIVFAWNFAEEVIRQRQDYLDAGGRFVIPVPEVRVVP